MVCPNCGGDDFVVLKIVKTTDGAYRRRRICQNAKCACRWTSTERVDAETIWLPGMPVPTGKHVAKGSTGIPQASEVPDSRGLPVGTTPPKERPKVPTGRPLPREREEGEGGGVSASGLGLVLIPSGEEQIRSTRRSRRPPSTLTETAAFQSFYLAYPRKEKRPAALRAWRKNGCEGIAATVMAGLALWQPEFAAREPDKVPHPASWLNGEQWRDRPPARSGPPRGGGDDPDLDAEVRRLIGKK